MLDMSLPPEIATALNEGPEPVTPRPSATVLLVRGRQPWELMLVHRPGGADFAPGAYVFPGGAVHDEDRRWPDEVAAAAVREVFEETGILLARGAGDADCASVRRLLAEGVPFPDALDRAGVRPDFEALVMFARWVTPAQLRRRFDARFYLARVPEGQTVHPQEGEVTDWLWVAPADALRRADLTLVYATRAVLESVAVHADAESLFEWARGLSEVPVIEPRIVQTPEGWKIVR